MSTTGVILRADEAILEALAALRRAFEASGPAAMIGGGLAVIA